MHHIHIHLYGATGVFCQAKVRLPQKVTAIWSIINLFPPPIIFFNFFEKCQKKKTEKKLRNVLPPKLTMLSVIHFILCFIYVSLFFSIAKVFQENSLSLHTFHIKTCDISLNYNGQS